MTIPFRAMRFPETVEQRWRIQLERLIPRASEESYWPAYSQTVDGRLNQAAVLNGVRDVSPGRNIQAHSVSRSCAASTCSTRTCRAARFRRRTPRSEIGLDAKFVLRDSFVLDMTLQPRLQPSRVRPAAGDRQPALRGAAIPERRPFFLENADYFATETPLLVTRRIVDPEGGAKFTGRQGPWGIGALLTNDEAAGLDVPLDRPALRRCGGSRRAARVPRLRQSVARRASCTRGSSSARTTTRCPPPTRMREAQRELADRALDGQHRDCSRTAHLTTGRQTNWRVNRNGRSFNTHFHWTDQNNDFDVPLGILGRNYTPDAEGLHGFVEYRFWPEDSWLDRIGPRVFFAHQEDGTGLRIYNEFSPQLQMTWSGDSSFNVGSNSIEERLRPQDFAGLDDDARLLAAALLRQLLDRHVTDDRLLGEYR